MENPVGACTGARDLGGANFLLDVIPYRHSDAAQSSGGALGAWPGLGAHIRKRRWGTVQARLRPLARAARSPRAPAEV